jgi:NAD(P)-dependent dehydrogenase (short-subunit alcohol dehydrogenase family)
MIDLGLAGRTVLVVGGSSNIGRAAVIAFAREGANVVIVARHRDDCEKVARIAADLGDGDVVVMAADATKYDQIEDVVSQTLDRFERIDVWVGSVGWDAPGDFLDVPRSEWDSIIATNYTYMLNCFHVLLPIMVKQECGTLITVSSVMGRQGHWVEPVYCGAKAAQITFSHCMARQYGEHGIRINVVAPGNTPPTSPDVVGGDNLHRGITYLTPDQRAKLAPAGKGLLAATPLGKWATADDVAASILFLASDVTAGHMTGQVIGVDGGLYMPH